MVRIGIIGTEVPAHLHVTVLSANNTYEIVGCYAPESRESMLFARKYRLVSYSSLDALFRYSDVIDIASDFPNIMSLAEKSLKALKHVYIAHPHRLTLDEMQYLSKLAYESGKTVQLGVRHNYCSVYESIAELNKTPQTVEIMHQLPQSTEDFCMQVKSELPYDLTFVLGILSANITKIDIHTWSKPEVHSDLLQCRLQCDNGSMVHLNMQTYAAGNPKLEVMFYYPDMELKADVFQSVIEKHYYEYDVVDSMVFDPYNERNICKQDLINFGKVACGDHAAISLIEQQLQCFAAADAIIERMQQTRTISAPSPIR
ncbi:MAG: Gfo/Idh/MocA family oxidoreductase [Bacteroidales bacterium]|jgi:hypothetical protein|nr:Gfo/Idh/MocA family oxidoreductase [Bacteroidales bacterium]